MRRMTSFISPNKVGVFQIPYSADLADLRNYFSHFGEVLDISLPPSKKNPGENKGFAFVVFATAEQQQKVLETDGHKVSTD